MDPNPGVEDRPDLLAQRQRQVAVANNDDAVRPLLGACAQ